jgi:S-DNA-T family DNA segregation ATPase FtsK/SpoIIIE
MQPKKVVKISDAQKRRPATRAKNQKAAQVVSASKTRERVRPRAWVRDTLSVLIFGCGLFLLLSVLSHAYHLASSHNTEISHNLMGTAGQLIAGRLFNTLGIVSLVPIIGMVWLAFFRLGGSEPRARLYPIPSVVLACFTSILSLAGLIALITQPLLKEPALGGSLGSWLVGASAKELGLGGSGIAMALVAVVSLAVILQRSIGDVAYALRFIAQGTIIAIGIRLPVLLTRVALILSGLFWGIAQRAFRVLGRLFVLKTSDEQEEGARGGVKKEVSRGWSLSKDEPAPAKQTHPQSTNKERIKAISDESERTIAVVDTPREVLIVKPQPRDIAGVTTLRKGNRGASDSSSPPSSKKRDEAEQTGSPNPQFDSYEAPALALLNREEAHQLGEDDDELRKIAEQIELKLKDFNIAGRVTQVHPGPVITLFEFEPAAGVKVGRIAALQDDLAMSLKASSIRIIAPLPKRGTVGIEVPNKHRAVVRLRECLESASFASADSILSVPLGKDTYGETIVVDIASMPHLLMAGATGTGKSVSINALLLSLLYRAHPAELGLILIDPKVLELSIYEGIPHLRVPVVTDPRQAKGVLSWAVKEMDRRYRYMQKFGVRNIDGYNRVVAGKSPTDDDPPPNSATAVQIQMFGEGDGNADTAVSDGDGGIDKPQVESIAAETLKPLPKLVIVIDELADLMLSVGREIEELITRLAQKARAAGIHLIVATQRPSVDVITGLIKANFPARLSFRVSSRIDSRTILDSMGAEKLLGKGDMLFMLPGAVPLKRVHGAFVSDQEVQKVVTAIKANCTPQYDEAIIAACDKAMSEGDENKDGGATGEGGAGTEEDFDPFYDKAVELVMEKGQASTSMIQRAFRIGYNRAARIIEVMEREGVVGKTDGVRPREVIVPSRINCEQV